MIEVRMKNPCGQLAINQIADFEKVQFTQVFRASAFASA